MYSAKEQRLGVVVYDPEFDDFSRERLSLGDELRRAIDERQLVLWYQPQIDAITHQVCGVEALVRWKHPTQRPDEPGRVPACRPARRPDADDVGGDRSARGRRPRQVARSAASTPRVAINCAPPELMSEIFIPRLATMLADAGLSPDRIVIEVTEDSFLAEPERARTVLLDLRDRGFQISIDDYGTGFSSLSYLRDLPIQELKIDRSFVSAMCRDQRSRMIVSSTLQMAHALGLRTVAEGVEDAATAPTWSRSVWTCCRGTTSPPDAAGAHRGLAQQTYTVARPAIRLAGTETASRAPGRRARTARAPAPDPVHADAEADQPVRVGVVPALVVDHRRDLRPQRHAGLRAEVGGDGRAGQHLGAQPDHVQHSAGAHVHDHDDPADGVRARPSSRPWYSAPDSRPPRETPLRTAMVATSQVCSERHAGGPGGAVTVDRPGRTPDVDELFSPTGLGRMMRIAATRVPAWFGDRHERRESAS